MSRLRPVDVHAVTEVLRHRSRRAADQLAERAARLRTLHIPAGWLAVIWIGLALLITQAIEVRTAVVQSHVFAAISRKLDWTMGPGPSPRIVLPSAGPLDTERGYARLSEFARRLEGRGYRLIQQARFSPTLAFLAKSGVTPPWREPSAAGLVIRGADGDTLYDALSDHHTIDRYDDIPPVVVRTLLYIENRELSRDGNPWANPAVDWGRFALATALYAGNRAGLPVRVEGGSTLAVQLEKFRHSEEGRTGSGLDKLRQIAAASLEAYHFGPDTRGVRKEIVLDYLNSIPLAATPSHGEVRGIADGLRLWFGRNPDQVWSSLRNRAPLDEQARAYRTVLALLCAVRAPTDYLVRDRRALADRMDRLLPLLAQAGVIDLTLARAVAGRPLAFTPPPRRTAYSFAERKAADIARDQLQRMLGVNDRYTLDRLHIEARTTIDPALQAAVYRTFRMLADPDSVAAHGLNGEHLLPTGDPSRIVYTFTLLERTPLGDRLCAYADNLDRPFDANGSMKLELGSTAKLRTLAHYLELMADLHRELAPLAYDSLVARAQSARDPLTLWAARTLLDAPALDMDAFLAQALEREYSANPWEQFFTGGGLHQFHNFDPLDNHRTLTIREAAIHSTNLVFVRLMRDIVRYHTARLPYDAAAVMDGSDSVTRQKLLEAFVDGESRQQVASSWRRYRAPGGADLCRAVAAEYRTLEQRYASTDFTLLDYGWLMRRPPLDVWCADAMDRDSTATLDTLLARSADARAQTSEWIFRTRNRHAQDLRLRQRIEQDAFARMTPAWQRLGFPFDALVPSYATAIGSSSDKPLALAELMGIILDDGIRQSTMLVPEIRFGDGSPYQTIFADSAATGARVMRAAVAHTLRALLAQVVDRGTAMRLRGVFTAADGTPIPIGGKTGSGDNRLVRMGRNGRVLGSQATSRTAAFAFYIGARHFGVVTAAVLGKGAGDYSFTSALPLELVKDLAPAIQQHLVSSDPADAAGDTLSAASRPAERGAPER